MPLQVQLEPGGGLEDDLDLSHGVGACTLGRSLTAKDHCGSQPEVSRTITAITLACLDDFIFSLC